jgi:hypothetical protein
VANLPPVSTTPVSKFAVGMNDNGGKFATGIKDTDSKFSTSFASAFDIGVKFATSVERYQWQISHRCQ